MKNFIVTIAFALMTTMTFAQSKSIASFYKAYSSDHATVSLNLSGNFLKFLADDEDDNEALKSITSIRILTIEHPHVPKAKFTNLINDVRKEGYEEWMTVKEGAKSEVVFFAKEDGKMITDLVMLVRGDEDYVILELTGLIDPDALENNSLNIDVEGFEHLKKAKDRKEK
ncbi:MAG: DUF4252 domain-containing protein [Flammeovirgaceae bacterium]